MKTKISTDGMTDEQKKGAQKAWDRAEGKVRAGWKTAGVTLVDKEDATKKLLAVYEATRAVLDGKAPEPDAASTDPIIMGTRLALEAYRPKPVRAKPGVKPADAPVEAPKQE